MTDKDMRGGGSSDGLDYSKKHQAITFAYKVVLNMIRGTKLLVWGWCYHMKGYNERESELLCEREREKSYND